MLEFTSFIIFVIVAFVLMIGLFYGLIYGAMYQRLPTRKLKKIIKLGNLNPNMTVFDLGAGFGRIMFEAAKSGATVIGYEIDPAKVFWLNQQIKKKIFTSDQVLHVDVRKENLLNANLAEADLVYCYLAPQLMQRLGEKAVKEMRKGSRIISVEHKINSLTPTFEDVKDKIYVYQL